MTRILLSTLLTLPMLFGCSVETDATAPAPGAANSTPASGDSLKDGPPVEVDGSSTVFPVSAAIAEEFMKETGATVNVGQSGTGSGFKRFVVGETDISDASRAMKDSEAATAEENGIEYEQLMVATDGISVVVNKENDWAKSLTVEQLKAIWEEGSEIKTWKDLDPSYPDVEIKLYGPGPESGTFDYFNESILEEGAPRSDYSASSDDNQTIKGVSDNRGGLGYFGYSYYINAKDQLNGVSIDNGEGPVEPTGENIESGKYAPLARPLFIFVNTAKAETNPTLRGYLDFYMSDEGQDIIREEGFVVLSAEALADTRAKVAALTAE